MSDLKKTTRICHLVLIICILGLQKCYSKESDGELPDKDEGLSFTDDSVILEGKWSFRAIKSIDNDSYIFIILIIFWYSCYTTDVHKMQTYFVICLYNA